MDWSVFQKQGIETISSLKSFGDDTRMIEIKENEIIVSEDEVREALKRTSFTTEYHSDEVIKELFNK